LNFGTSPLNFMLKRELKIELEWEMERDVALHKKKEK
jgi:hypothetical protein